MVSLGIFSVVLPTELCALRLTQPLKVSTRDFFWGKGGRCVWLTTYHPRSAETSRKSGALTYPEPLGPPRSIAGLLYFTLSGILEETNNTSKVCSLQIKLFCLLSHWNVKSLNNNANFCNNRLWKCNKKINIPHISSLDGVAQTSTETHNGKM